MGEYADSILWLIAFVVFVAVEGVTFGLVSIWFACGALLALGASLLGLGGIAQFAVFLGSAALALAVTRPAVKRFLSTRKTRTNSDRIVGELAVVTLRVDPVSGSGQIKALGQIWSAKPADGVSKYDEGTEVFITEISGVKAVVTRAAPKSV